MAGKRTMSRALLLWTLTFATSLVSGQAITSCPSTPTLVTNDQGIQFEICHNADYQGPSTNIINDVKTELDCLNQCRTTAGGCTKAVYDQPNAVCHIKGDASTTYNWVQSSYFTSIRYTKTLKDGDAIALTSTGGGCPTQETLINNSDGSQSAICPMSDYQTGSVLISGSIPDVASCAALCAQTSGCAKAVYDHIYSACHLKGNPSSVPWVVNLKQYDSIRIVRSSGSSTTRAVSSATTITTSLKKTTTTTSSAAATTTKASSGLRACPTGATTFTTDDGSLYEFCPNTDYQGQNTQTLQNVLSPWDCLQQCNQRNCTSAVFDSKQFICYIKDKTSVWVTSTQYQTVRFVSKKAFTPSPNTGLGAWSAPVIMPVIPVAAYVVPQQPLSNRVLMFSSWGPDDFSGPTGITQFADYNWQSGAVSQRTITNTEHDMFCPGISSLQDGRIVITGGENAEATTFFDPQSNTFIKGPAMNIPRGYQSSATTSAGKIFTVGGSFSGGIGGKTGEIFDPSTNKWTVLPGANVTQILTSYDAEGAWRTDNHAWLYGWKDGSVFQAGPSKQQHWFDTKSNGRVVASSIRDPNNDAMCGVNVMYDAVAGKILSTGGSQSYTNSDAWKTSHITTIGAAFSASQVERVADMASARGFANGVVLPDGTVLVTGGQKRSMVFTDVDSAMKPELFNPTTKTWKELAPAALPRNYHSVSLLLADGTVFVGGGGMCPTAYNQDDSWCNRASDHPNAEIFSPPYLFVGATNQLAQRPIIFATSSTSDASGNTVKVGDKLTVNMNDESDMSFALVRMGSATHSINTDQRRVPLSNVTKNKAAHTIQLPTDSGILLPGYYYLFAMYKQTGVPCVAKTIQVRL